MQFIDVHVRTVDVWTVIWLNGVTLANRISEWTKTSLLPFQINHRQ